MIRPSGYLFRSKCWMVMLVKIYISCFRNLTSSQNSYYNNVSVCVTMVLKVFALLFWLGKIFSIN